MELPNQVFGLNIAHKLIEMKCELLNSILKKSLVTLKLILNIQYLKTSLNDLIKNFFFF